MSDYTPTTQEIRDAWWSEQCAKPDLDFDDIYNAAFDRWLTAHDAEVRAAVLAEQGEPDWEYGTAHLTPAGKIWNEALEESRADAEDHVRECMAGCIVVKRALVPWLPVEDPS